MRLTILSNADLPSCIALNHLIPALREHELSVFLSSRVGSSGAVSGPPALAQLRFYEQTLFNDILFPLLAASHAHRETDLLGFSALAPFLVQPVTVLNRINTEEGRAQIAAAAPELMLSIRYGVILKDPVLAIPPRGVLNLHSGLLPDYKGVMATFRALLNGDTTIGTTLHWIDDSNIDTGRIIGTTQFPVNPGKSYLWHVLALYEDGCRLMRETVQTLAQGDRVAAATQSAGGAYYSFPEQAELDAFHAKGWRLFETAELELVAKRFMGLSTTEQDTATGEGT